VEIYRTRELPAILQTALPAVVRGLAAKELAGKEYDKTRKHKVEKFIDLPDPTLKDLTRMKRHQVVGLTEEYRVQAKLDGQADIRLPAMPLLTSCAEGGSGLMLFAVEASLPVQGRVQYQVPEAASASTGYHTTVWLAAVAEVPLERSGKDVTVGLPTLLDFRVSLVHLKLSNDLLDVARRQIERYVNHELRQNDEKIREQANRAIKKAISSHEVRLPLLGYLGLLDNS
jgi:signal transduction histidine kinase